MSFDAVLACMQGLQINVPSHLTSVNARGDFYTCIDIGMCCIIKVLVRLSEGRLHAVAALVRLS